MQSTKGVLQRGCKAKLTKAQKKRKTNRKKTLQQSTFTSDTFTNGEENRKLFKQTNSWSGGGEGKCLLPSWPHFGPGGSWLQPITSKGAGNQFDSPGHVTLHMRCQTNKQKQTRGTQTVQLLNPKHLYRRKWLNLHYSKLWSTKEEEGHKKRKLYRKENFGSFHFQV